MRFYRFSQHIELSCTLDTRTLIEILKKKKLTLTPRITPFEGELLFQTICFRMLNVQGVQCALGQTRISHRVSSLCHLHSFTEKQTSNKTIFLARSQSKNKVLVEFTGI